MPRYVYNLVYLDATDRQVEWHREPEHFPGPAADFAKAALLAWLNRHPARTDQLVIANVWDADLDGAGVPGRMLVQLSNTDLDEGPFDPNQLYLSFGHYHIVSTGYDFFDDDAILGLNGRDYTHGTPHGLIVPGQGPALRIRAGHKYGWITLNVAVCDAEPAIDLSVWDAVELATIRPVGEVRVADHAGEMQPHFPDLSGGRAVGHLAIRVSVRGRSSTPPTPSAAHPRHTPVEHHVIEAWPVAAAAPRRVLKRDDLSLAYERADSAGSA
jgi:hypothetical protein